MSGDPLGRARGGAQGVQPTTYGTSLRVATSLDVGRDIVRIVGESPVSPSASPNFRNT